VKARLIMDKSTQIFLSYAQRDKPLEQELLKHLKLLELQSQVTILSTDYILAGQSYKQAIQSYLERADIILLLISADFLASRENMDTVAKALEKQGTDKAQVIPIILRPSLWQETELHKLQVLPRNERPLTEWANPDAAYLDVVEGVREAVKQLTSPEKVRDEEQFLQTTLQSLSEREIRLLGFDLGLPPDIIQKSDATALIAYMKSQDRLKELAAYVRRKRLGTR